MRRSTSSGLLRAGCLLLVALGVILMVFVVYLDLVGGRAAMVCGSPTDPICTGQYVYGFPNGIWPGLAIVVGITGLILMRKRRWTTPRG